MSLADKFDNEVEPTFTHSFDPESARRQLRISITLVAAMGLAAFVLGFLSPIGGKDMTKNNMTGPDSTSTFSGRLVSFDKN
ncbi:MAG: hypothetical protein WAK01_01510 [Methylocystis sp.]